jgi:hypothetical protein
MTDTSATRIAELFFLLSTAAELGALGIAFSHGSGPASMNAMNWGIGEQLVITTSSRQAAPEHAGVSHHASDSLTWHF